MYSLIKRSGGTSPEICERMTLPAPSRVGEDDDGCFFCQRAYERRLFAVFEYAEAVGRDYLRVDDRGELLAVVFPLHYHGVWDNKFFVIHFFSPNQAITAMPRRIL